ncbi:MAG: hypothetical protein BWY55_00131 [archaeon ADurb.Bin336]|jgi:hypothetical protein|nr:MAG: hypothetical protein BWY55_00131 [archaeon ADurb.Bin336]
MNTILTNKHSNTLTQRFKNSFEYIFIISFEYKFITNFRAEAILCQIKMEQGQEVKVQKQAREKELVKQKNKRRN